MNDNIANAIKLGFFKRWFISHLILNYEVSRLNVTMRVECSEDLDLLLETSNDKGRILACSTTLHR